jgi:hypothetical protein
VPHLDAKSKELHFSPFNHLVPLERFSVSKPKESSPIKDYRATLSVVTQSHARAGLVAILQHGNQNAENVLSFCFGVVEFHSGTAAG